MRVTRYELLVDEKNIGFIRPVWSLGLISDESYEFLNENLAIPNIKQKDCYAKCYFTEKGIKKFQPILQEIRENVRKYTHLQLRITETILEIKEVSFLYHDEFQVVVGINPLKPTPPRKT